MKLNNKYRIDPQFNMSSMTDIVFLLLIFFMLTVSSVNNQGLPVELPNSEHADSLAPQVNVTITEDLQYYIDQEPVAKTQLKEALKKNLDKSQPLVLLQIDKRVPVAHLVYVTDMAAALQAKIAVATQPNEL